MKKLSLAVIPTLITGFLLTATTISAAEFIFEDTEQYIPDSEITATINNYIHYDENRNNKADRSVHIVDYAPESLIYTEDDETYYITEIIYKKDITEYSGGKMMDFLKDSNRNIFVYANKSKYSAELYYKETDMKEWTLTNFRSYSNVFNESLSPDYIAKRDVPYFTAPYDIGGNVYILEEFGCEYAIITDENDYPKYVVFYTGWGMYQSSESLNDSGVFTHYAKKHTDSEEILKLTAKFDELYNEGFGEAQIVYDFDFVYDVFRARLGKLDESYTFKPHGFESTYISKTKTINGITYRFNKDGRCTGTMDGWSKSSKGRRYFQNGKYLTGTQEINGKTYVFDENGYVKE